MSVLLSVQDCLTDQTERADVAHCLTATTRMVRRFTLASRGIFLTAVLYLRGNRGTLPRPAGFSNRVGSPPTQPGGLLWLRERLGWFAVVLAATESCEERDSPGIRPCGVTPADLCLGKGGGAASRARSDPCRTVRRPNWGRPICATAATLGLFPPAATKLAC